MCMFVKAGKDELMTAEKPIKCFKKVWIHHENGKIYFSSEIQSFIYELGKTYSLRDVLDGEALNNFLSPKYKDGKWLIVEEGFHSYVTLERAMQHYDGTLPCVILECEIPEGSRYRIGTNVHLPDRDMYCSSMLSVVAWKYQGEDAWRRPMLSPYEVRPSVSILKGLTITEAKERLGYWYLCESCQLNFNVGWYVFNRVGTYGRLELWTYCNRVTNVV